MHPASPTDDAARRGLEQAVAQRLRPRLGDAALVAQLSALGAAWLLADPARLRPNAVGHRRLAADAAFALRQLGRTLAWVLQPRFHHGQQAGQQAAKMLRGLRTGRLDMDTLLDGARRFRVLRQGHLRRRAQEKPHAPAETVALDGGSYVATRVTSVRDLRQLGQDAGNCLASPVQGRGYATELRRGAVAFWRIDPVHEVMPDADAEAPPPTWVVSLCTRLGRVREVGHAGPGLTMPVDRDVLLEFLAKCSFPDAGHNVLPYDISPVLLAAERAGSLRRFVAGMAGATWRFEAGPGVLTAIAEGDGQLALENESGITMLALHGLRTGIDAVLRVQLGWPPPWSVLEDDSWYPSADVYRRGLAVREALRTACRRPGPLRDACAEAFAAEDPAFRRDWFGR